MIKVTAKDLIPKKSTKGSAGYDLFSSEDGVVPAKGSVVVSTGVYVDMPIDMACHIKSRSGLAFNHDLIAFHGLIDSDYKKEIMVKIFNLGSRDYAFYRGDRIAQLVFMKVEQAEGDVIVVNADRDGGFSSTGK